MKCLPDINVWLALTFSGHEHHAAAVDWFDQVANDSCAFCRMTQQGFLRLASNPMAMLRDALSLPKSWAAYDRLLSDPRVFYADEAPGTEDEWRALTGEESFSVKIWNDAFLSAFAKSSGLQMVTFDRGFKRYAGLKLKVLG